MGCLCHLMQMAIGQPAGRRAATLRSSHRCRALRPGVERRNLSIRLISARPARNAEMDERYTDNSDRSRTTASRRTCINLRRTTIAYLSIHRREHERQWWRPIDVASRLRVNGTIRFRIDRSPNRLMAVADFAVRLWRRLTIQTVTAW